MVVYKALITFTNPHTVQIFDDALMLTRPYCRQPKLAKWTRVPFPIELLVVMAGTLGSFLGDLSGRYDLQVIGNVTTG